VGITGTEIIDGQRHAHSVQAVKLLLNAVIVTDQQRLSQLQLQQVRRQPGTAQDGFHQLRQFTVPELHHGNIHRYANVAKALGTPVHTIGTGPLQHPAADFMDNATAFCQRNKLIRVNKLPAFLRPAQQGFTAVNPAIAQIVLGLVIKVELLFFQGVPHQLRSEEHTSELQSRENLVCRLLLEKKKSANT